MTPIRAFGQEQQFKSIEHAFFWKMATDLGQDNLALHIREAAHAGVVKRLSKEMEESSRYQWEENNTNIMKDLHIEKARTCDQFRDCLLMNNDKILAESTFSKRWGTGLSKWLTERTKPQYWPGQNILGLMLMEISTDDTIFTTRQTTSTDNIMDDQPPANNSSVTPAPNSDEEDSTADEEENDNKIQDNVNSQPADKIKERKKKKGKVRGSNQAMKSASSSKTSNGLKTTATTRSNDTRLSTIKTRKDSLSTMEETPKMKTLTYVPTLTP